MPYGTALMGGGMKCLFDFIMMVKPVSMIMTKSLLRESPVICMSPSEAGRIPHFDRETKWQEDETRVSPAQLTVQFRENLSAFDTVFWRIRGYLG